MLTRTTLRRVLRGSEMSEKDVATGSQIDHDNGTLTVERARARCTLDGILVELDGILIRGEDLSAFLAANPAFAVWRVLRFPVSGWVVLIEPASATSTRYRESLLKAGTGEIG